jgi:hypothetical protein
MTALTIIFLTYVGPVLLAQMCYEEHQRTKRAKARNR